MLLTLCDRGLSREQGWIGWLSRCGGFSFSFLFFM